MPFALGYKIQSHWPRMLGKIIWSDILDECGKSNKLDSIFLALPRCVPKVFFAGAAILWRVRPQSESRGDSRQPLKPLAMFLLPCGMLRLNVILQAEFDVTDAHRLLRKETLKRFF